MTVPVLAAPLLDPGCGRVRVELPEGSTIAQIVATVFPAMDEAHWHQVRAVLVSTDGAAVVSRDYWRRVKPRAGVQVVLRLVPGRDALRSVLQVVVSIAAVAIGAYFAPALAGTLGISQGLAQGIIGLGVTVLGSLLINALIPPVKPSDKDKATFFISGWRNAFEPDGVIPEVYGQMRFAPPFAATSYTEIVGDLQYVRAMFLVGYGGDHGVALSGFRIGDDALSDFDEVSIETRDGLASDDPFSLYRQQVVETSLGVELTRNKPRDDLGDIIDGPAIEDAVVRTTGADAAGCSVIIGFPAGLGRIDDKSRKRDLTVQIRIRQRLAESGDPFEDVITLDVTAKKLEGFYRQYTWEFPERGRYEVELTRMTDEHTGASEQSRTSWVAIQTLRPEYPIDYSHPLALVAVRVKATYQLNGQLDNFNLIASRRCLDWDTATQSWVVRETSNPASLFRFALQSKSNPKPVPDSEIDLPALQAWHDYCRIKGLEYDAIHNDDRSLRERLTEITAAGRARQRHDGVKWSVVVDRPQDLVVDHISPRNSKGFKASRTYFDPPHGFRIKFFDRTNDYKAAERLVPWPGHAGDITLTEELQLPGKTNPDEIWIEARRRMYEAIYRIDSYQVTQDGAARVATRGDQVMCSIDVLERTQVSARVKSVQGRLIELDELFSMQAGKSYGIRFRQFEDSSDTIGTSIVMPLQTSAGESNVVVLATSAGSARPSYGDIVHLGELGNESLGLVVRSIEAGEDFSQHLTLVNAAPIIDELTDAEVPPAWSGRAGADVGAVTDAPPVPTITSISSGVSGTDTIGALTIRLVPGSGSVATSSYRVRHKLQSASVWSAVDVPVANGAVTVGGYATGNLVDVQAAALSPAGILGSYSSIITVTIGAGDAAIPGALDPASVSIGALLGGAVIMFSTSDDPSVVAVSIYRSTGSSYDPESDLVGTAIGVSPSRGYSVTDGDATRTNLLTDGGFDSAGAWSAGSGWAVASGKATHVGGTASNLSQTLGLSGDRYYRIAYTVLDRTAGDVRPRLGSSIDGAAANFNGSFSSRLQAPSGAAQLAFVASAGFVGSVDDVLMFEETASCLSAGTHNYWLVPQNSDGVPGPAAGPFPVSIR